MHEASLALGILDVIINKSHAEGYTVIESVRIKIGRAAGIMPDALQFTFDIAKSDTPARDAKLTIDVIPLGGFCNGCQHNFEVEDTYVLSCPLCGSSHFTLQKGYEMEIVDMEVH